MLHVAFGILLALALLALSRSIILGVLALVTAWAFVTLWRVWVPMAVVMTLAAPFIFWRALRLEDARRETASREPQNYWSSSEPSNTFDD